MPEPRILSAAEAIREALDLALARWPEVYLLGEGVADPKGIFGTTLGLAEKYGRDRVVETPVAENGLTGVAIGSALMGRRPVLIHQRVDFALLSLEQLFNSAAKSHYVTNGRHRVPLVDQPYVAAVRVLLDDGLRQLLGRPEVPEAAHADLLVVRVGEGTTGNVLVVLENDPV